MHHAPKDAPSALPDLLLANRAAGKPLLEGAVLYRGTRLPDQTQGSFSQDKMHGSLLLQVAASYTHNWEKGEAGFIGAYPISRETRFYADFGLEQALNGKTVPSHSTQEVEAALAPLVDRLAQAKEGSERHAATAALEKLVHRQFYEADIPTRTPEGAPHRPATLFAFHGEPTAQSRQEVLPDLERLGPHNEHIAKDAVYARYRNEVQSELHGIDLTPGFPGRQGYATARAIAQTEFGREIRAEHGDKPLNAFLDAVAQQPVSKRQQHLGEMTKAMADACASRDPAIQGAGIRVSSAIAKLDPDRSRYADMLSASRAALAPPNHQTEQGRDANIAARGR